MRRIAVVFGAVALVAAFAAGAVGAGPLPGTKTAKDRAAWRAILHWPASCEDEWKIGGPGAGIVVWRTAGRKRLVEVTCSLAAYQGTSMLFLVDTSRHKIGPLALHTYRDPGSGHLAATHEREILGILGFTPGTGRLVVFVKFRGLGDCGLYSTFRLANDAFVPVEVRAKTACDGKPPFEPQRWPLLPLPSGP